jgi:hypothetical protein
VERISSRVAETRNFSSFMQINLPLHIRVLNVHKICNSTKIPQTAVLALFVGYLLIMNTLPPFSTTQELSFFFFTFSYSLPHQQQTFSSEISQAIREMHFGFRFDYKNIS